MIAGILGVRLRRAAISVGRRWNNAPMATRSRGTAVCVERGAKKVFASALEWPGWSRSGKTEEAALEALAEYLPRYAAVADRARVELPKTAADSFDVVERVDGDAGTDFGVPSIAARADFEPVSADEAARIAALVTGAWTDFDEIVVVTPAVLRKGPRGGGRDRDKMVGHVLEAESAYARKIGIKLPPPAIDDIEAIEALREAIATELALPSDGSPPVERGWPHRYAARRIAWHVLDHAWEMQDRTEPGSELPADLPAPARRALEGAGYTTLDALAAVSERDLLLLHGMGPKAVSQLREALAEHKLTFAGE
jgi:hypothetical protein